MLGSIDELQRRRLALPWLANETELAKYTHQKPNSYKVIASKDPEAPSTVQTEENRACTDSKGDRGDHVGQGLKILNGHACHWSWSWSWSCNTGIENRWIFLQKYSLRNVARHMSLEISRFAAVMSRLTRLIYLLPCMHPI